MLNMECRVFSLFLIGSIFLAPVALGQKYSRFDDHPSEKDAFVKKLRKKSNKNKDEALKWAKARGLPIRENRGHQVIELMAIVEGNPLYYITHNQSAAISTSADLLVDSLMHDLDGSGVTVGVWDGGWIRTTHREFGSRVTVKDSDTESRGNNDHATHVGGTISAMGLDSSTRGMAPNVKVHSYGWDGDLAEMGSAAASAPFQSSKLYLSNHSYGLKDPNSYFGQYMDGTEDIDQIVYGHTYYLPFVSAGNDRAEISGGYDTISYYGIAKNVMTVGAVRDAVSGGSRSISSALLTSFSSCGPADDGRIKPDIVANGYELRSTVSSGDSAYAQTGWSGTSMSSPNASGSAALLVEYYKELFSGGAMWASTLKGLIIHTADDLGRPGPDYQYGWGLMNTKRAADLLLDYADDNPQRLTEATLNSAGPEDSYSIFSGGNDSLRITLCWSDPAGIKSSAVHLKNDLNLRIETPDGIIMYPYKLNPLSPAVNATRGENNVDNVEQIYIDAPKLGRYTVTVDYKGSLTDGAQKYSLLMSGLSNDSDDDGMPDYWEKLYFSSSTAAVPSADLDGDGADNLSEYIAGTLPDDSSSIFKIETHSMTDAIGSPFIISWQPKGGRIYNVLWSDNLQYIPFTNTYLSGDLPYPVNSYTDAVPLGVRANFYRVDVKIAP